MKFADPKNDIAFKTIKELEVYDYISIQEGKRINELETARLDGERNKQIEIAIKSLKKGLDIEVISDITGLSVEEIKELK